MGKVDFDLYCFIVSLSFLSLFFITHLGNIRKKYKETLFALRFLTTLYDTVKLDFINCIAIT